MSLRYKDIGGSFSNPLLISGSAPIDQKSVVSTLLDLYDPSTWFRLNGRVKIWLTYLGLLVFVEETKEIYVCLLNINPSTAECWRKISPVENSSVNIEWENDLDNFSDLINNEEQENNGEEQNNSEDPTPRQEESGE